MILFHLILIFLGCRSYQCIRAVVELHSINESLHGHGLLLAGVVWGGQAQRRGELKGLSGGGGGQQDVVLRWGKHEGW